MKSISFRKNASLLHKSNGFWKCPFRCGQTGSVALEYVLVSTFATVVAVALLGLAGHIFKQKVAGVMDRLAIDADEIELNIFEDLP